MVDSPVGASGNNLKMAVNMAFSTIQYEIKKGDATGVLNRPENMNAIDATLYEEVKAAYLEAEQNDEVRVLLITGAGERAFCAGADLKSDGKDRVTDRSKMRVRDVYPERALNPTVIGFSK